MRKSFADRRRAARAWTGQLLYDVLCGVLVQVLVARFAG